MSAPHDPAVDERWGRQVEGSAKPKRLRRLLVIVLVALLVLTLAIPPVLSSRIPRIPVDNLARSGGGPTNVLIAGSDSREGLSREEMRELSTGFADEFEGERTDTILLLSFQGSDTAMLSFPRDLWVERCDGSVGRINVAQSLDGPGCLVDTVERVSGLDIHHYTRVTFGGFRDVVDAVGGVEMCLDEAIADRDAGIDLPAGCQRLDGADALGFVRVRKIDDDLARVERQQRFLRALASEVTEPSTMFNPARLWTLANDAGGAVQVSDSLGTIGLMRVGWAGRSLASGDVPMHTVPTDPRTTSGGAEVLEVRTAEAQPLFASFADGSVFGQAATSVDPGDVEVAVRNGAGVSGLAGQVGEQLETQGFDVVDVGNAEPRERTIVRHPPGQAEAAQLVADRLPGDPAIEEGNDVSNVTVILGDDAGGGA